MELTPIEIMIKAFSTTGKMIELHIDSGWMEIYISNEKTLYIEFNEDGNIELIE